MQRRGRLKLIWVSLEPALHLCLPAIHLINWGLSSLAYGLFDHILDSKSSSSYRGLLHREIQRLLECASLPSSGIYRSIVSHYACSTNYRALLAAIPYLLLPILRPSHLTIPNYLSYVLLPDVLLYLQMLIAARAPRRFISRHLPPGVPVVCGLCLGMLGFDLPSKVDELTLQLRVDVTLLRKGATGEREGAAS